MMKTTSEPVGCLLCGANTNVNGYIYGANLEAMLNGGDELTQAAALGDSIAPELEAA